MRHLRKKNTESTCFSWYKHDTYSCEDLGEVVTANIGIVEAASIQRASTMEVD